MRAAIWHLPPARSNRMVRHGHLPAREVMTGIGPMRAKRITSA
jgi:hypothetical protein